MGADRAPGESLCWVSHVPKEAPLLQKPEAGCVGVDLGGTEVVDLGPGLLLSSERPCCVQPVELGSAGPCWAQGSTAHAGSAGLREMKRVSWGQHVAPHPGCPVVGI